jgi:hypothetical protein
MTRRQLLLRFIEDHPVTALLIVAGIVAFVYVCWRMLFAVAGALEFTK